MFTMIRPRQRRRLWTGLWLSVLFALNISLTSAFSARLIHSTDVSKRAAASRTRRLLGSLSSSSSSPPQAARGGSSSKNSLPLRVARGNWKDVWSVLLYTVTCLGLALSISLYQDYDCSTLKPNGMLRERALYGMGATSQLVESNSDVPFYNTILQHHREWRVQMWKSPPLSRNQAIATLTEALQALTELKHMANNYQWTDMQTLMKQSILSSQLEEACTSLRLLASSMEERDEIGFDWGSCAWRHCGAQADAQEALAELYNLVGILEPYECLFCIDIVERSIRDVLSAVKATTAIPPYNAYVPRAVNDNDGQSSSALDMDYLQALNVLRSNLI